MPPTADKLIELIAHAGSPLTLDQVMDMLPYADRKSVSALCRELVQAGQLRSSVEDGRVVYDVSGGVSRIRLKPSTSAPLTNLERIRQLLMAAKKPLSKDEIQRSLPDMAPATVGKTLGNGAYRKLWASTRRADGVHVYAMPQTGAGSATAVAVATATAAPAPAPAPAAAALAPASAPTPRAPAPTPPTAPAPAPRPAASAPPLGQLLDEAVSAAEQAVEEYVASVGSLALYRTLKHAAARARAARAALGR
jgi:hypothetical protein